MAELFRVTGSDLIRHVIRSPVRDIVTRRLEPFSLLVGNNGGFLHGYRDPNDANPFGGLNPNTWRGETIYQITGNSGGAGNAVISFTGNIQVNGVMAIAMNLEGFGEAVVAWNDSTQRYDEYLPEFGTYLRDNDGNNLEFTLRAVADPYAVVYNGEQLVYNSEPVRHRD